MVFQNKTAVITGASRGIGKAMAVMLAAEGANIVIASKTVEPHPKLEGTIYTAAEEIRRAGSGAVIAVQADIRKDEDIDKIMQEAVSAFGGIDILINNASAINLAPTEQMDPKRYDLMQDINVRGAFFMCRAAIPHLKAATNPHILSISPPLNMDRKWFPKHLAYTMSKYGMSMVVMGLASELKKYGIAVNALWPKTIIATAAIRNLPNGEEMIRHSRKPEIVADAARHILRQPSKQCTGNFFIDEELLRNNGVDNFDNYSVEPGVNLLPDLFI